MTCFFVFSERAMRRYCLVILAAKIVYFWHIRKQSQRISSKMVRNSMRFLKIKHRVSAWSHLQGKLTWDILVNKNTLAPLTTKIIKK